MSRLKLDFSEIESFEAMDKGEYLCVVDEVEHRDSDTYGKEYDSLEWRLTVTEDGPYKGRKLWFYTSFSPKALWRMKQVFENLGFADNEIDVEVDEDTNLIIEPQLTGMPVMAVVVQGSYEGRVTNSVDTLLSPDDQPVKVAKGALPAKTKTTKTTAKAPAKATQKAGGRKFK